MEQMIICTHFTSSMFFLLPRTCDREQVGEACAGSPPLSPACIAESAGHDILTSTKVFAALPALNSSRHRSNSAQLLRERCQVEAGAFSLSQPAPHVSVDREQMINNPKEEGCVSRVVSWNTCTRGRKRWHQSKRNETHRLDLLSLTQGRRRTLAWSEPRLRASR